MKTFKETTILLITLMSLVGMQNTLVAQELQANSTSAALVSGNSNSIDAGMSEKAKKKPERLKELLVVKNSPSKYKLIYLDETKETVQIILKSKTGRLLYKERIENNGGFARPYDLSELPEGDYRFEVIKEDGTMIERKINNSHIVQKSFYLGLNEVKEGTFQLAVVNRVPTSGPFIINIYDASSNLLHTEKVKATDGFRRNYNLSKFHSSSFQFTVSNATGAESKETR